MLTFRRFSAGDVCRGNPRSAIYCLLLPAACLFLLHQGSDARAEAWPDISTVHVTGGLIHPVHITHAGDGSRRLFVVEQAGRIRIIRADRLLAVPFLDISDRVLAGGERGLLSVAFPPGFALTGCFYVDYTRQPDGATVIARYRTTKVPDIADPASEEVIAVISQPFANHNGGQLAFGPDGFLYIGMGDGGSGGDPLGNAQDALSLLGKVLRIDVESGAVPYGIPADNPFVGVPFHRPEVWALGLRNPWRFSFDRSTGDLYIGDVGQNFYEEVDFQPASSPGGENYGWNIMEASHCYPGPSCDTAGLLLPVAEYDHSLGDCAVTGGIVYRGPTYPGMQGVYLYGDYCSGHIRGLRNEGNLFPGGLLADTPFLISTFGEDEVGNMYLADLASGDLYRVVDRAAEIPVPTGQEKFVFPAVDSPVAGADPASINPFGFGPFVSGGATMQIRVAAARFSGPVDIFAAYSVSTDTEHVFVLGPDLAFRTLSVQTVQQALEGAPSPGIEPWLKGVTGPVDVNVFTFPAADLPPGIYTVYLLAAPAGSTGSYYLAEVSFSAP